MAGPGNERPHFAKELGESRFVAQQNVVRAVEVDEPRTRYARRQRLALLERDSRVVPGVENQGRYTDLLQKCRDIHVAKGRMKPAGIGRRSGLFLQIVEPSHLLS